MLDDVKLSTRLKIAIDWFRRSRTGEFQFTAAHADRFEELLGGCITAAEHLEVSTPPEISGDNVVRLFEGLAEDARRPAQGGAS